MREGTSRFISQRGKTKLARFRRRGREKTKTRRTTTTKTNLISLPNSPSTTSLPLLSQPSKSSSSSSLSSSLHPSFPLTTHSNLLTAPLTSSIPIPIPNPNPTSSSSVLSTLRSLKTSPKTTPRTALDVNERATSEGGLVERCGRESVRIKEREEGGGGRRGCELELESESVVEGIFGRRRSRERGERSDGW